jgi:hypothetical protein
VRLSLLLMSLSDDDENWVNEEYNLEWVLVPVEPSMSTVFTSLPFVLTEATQTHPILVMGTSAPWLVAKC